MDTVGKYNNPHSSYIDRRINDYKKSNKWNTKIINTSHEDIIKDFGSSVFTNLIRDTFTKSYMKKYPCSDCKKESEERCHGINEDRPLLIKRALERIHKDIAKEIKLRDIIVAFLEEHKTTKFTFKCKICHKKESKVNIL